MSLTRNERVWKSWVIAALCVLPQHVADSSLIPSPTHPCTHTPESARSKIYILIVTFRVGLIVDRPGWNQTHFVNGRAISVERSPTVLICVPGALWQKMLQGFSLESNPLIAEKHQNHFHLDLTIKCLNSVALFHLPLLKLHTCQ